MKKTYKAPEMSVVFIGQHLLAPVSEFNKYDTTVSDPNAILSRRHNNAWDDEDDYDE
jgi:hypothetical protein